MLYFGEMQFGGLLLRDTQFAPMHDFIGSSCLPIQDSKFPRESSNHMHAQTITKREKNRIKIKSVTFNHIIFRLIDDW